LDCFVALCQAEFVAVVDVDAAALMFRAIVAELDDLSHPAAGAILRGGFEGTAAEHEGVQLVVHGLDFEAGVVQREFGDHDVG